MFCAERTIVMTESDRGGRFRSRFRGRRAARPEAGGGERLGWCCGLCIGCRWWTSTPRAGTGCTTSPAWLPRRSPTATNPGTTVRRRCVGWSTSTCTRPIPVTGCWTHMARRYLVVWQAGMAAAEQLEDSGIQARAHRRYGTACTRAGRYPAAAPIAGPQPQGRARTDLLLVLRPNGNDRQRPDPGRRRNARTTCGRRSRTD